MNYVSEMREAILALDRMQGSIRANTVGTDEELCTLYPLLSLYEQLAHVNFRNLEQHICEHSEYEIIRNAITDRTNRYREWITDMGGKIK